MAYRNRTTYAVNRSVEEVYAVCSLYLCSQRFSYFYFLTMVLWHTKVKRLADRVSNIQRTAVQKDVGSLLPVPVLCMHVLLPWYSGISKSNTSQAARSIRTSTQQTAVHRVYR